MNKLSCQQPLLHILHIHRCFFKRPHIYKGLFLISFIGSIEIASGEPVTKFIPQAELTALQPNLIDLHPRNANYILVLNAGGRLDFFSIYEPDNIVKTNEFQTGASYAIFHPDGDRVITGQIDGTIKIWSLEGKQLFESSHGHNTTVTAMTVASNEDTIVSGAADGTIHFWNMNGRKSGESVKAHEHEIVGLSFHQQANLIVSAGRDGHVRLWTLDGIPAETHFAIHEDQLLAYAVSPNGRHIATVGTTGVVKVRSMDGRNVAPPIRTPHNIVTRISFSRDGARIITGGTDGTLCSWYITGEQAAPCADMHKDSTITSLVSGPETGTVVSAAIKHTSLGLLGEGEIKLSKFGWVRTDTAFQGHEGNVLSLDFSPRGDLVVSGGSDETVRLWTSDGRLIDSFHAHTGWITAVSFDPSGNRIVTGGDDGYIRLWDLSGQELIEPIAAHNDWITAAAFSPSGELIASASFDGTVRIWKSDGSHAAPPFRGHKGQIWDIAFSPSGEHIASAGADGTLRIWDKKGNLLAGPFAIEDVGMHSVAFSSSGNRIATGATDGNVRLWNPDGSIEGTITTSNQDVFAVVFDNMNNVLATGDSGLVQIYSLLQEKFKSENLVSEITTAYSLAQNKEGTHIIAGGENGDIISWKLAQRQIGKAIRGVQSQIRDFAFDEPAENFSIVSFDGSESIYKISRGEGAKHISTHTTDLNGTFIRKNGVAYSDTGNEYYSIFAEGYIMYAPKLQARADGEWKSKIVAQNTAGAASLAIAANGKYIAVGDTAGSIAVLSREGDLIGRPFTGHSDVVTAVAFNKEGNGIVTGSVDKTIRFWSLEGQQEDKVVETKLGVTSVAISGEWSEVVVGSLGGTVLIMDMNGKTRRKLQFGCLFPIVRAIRTDQWAVACGNRIHILDNNFKEMGTIFTGKGGLVAVTTKGILPTSRDLYGMISAIDTNGRIRTDITAFPTINSERTREILFDDLTLPRQLKLWVLTQAEKATALYKKIPEWAKFPFWLFLATLLVILAAALMLLMLPAALATWVMQGSRSSGGRLPFLSLEKYLYFFFKAGHTRRALRCWLRKNRSVLVKSAFLEREPVLQRRNYYSVGLESMMSRFVQSLERSAICWIEGPGGSGKSALAFFLARVTLASDRRRPLPVLVYTEWSDSLAAEVGRQLQLFGRNGEVKCEPTPTMVKKMGQFGMICPVLDSLSELCDKDAIAKVSREVHDGYFHHLIVTSRMAPPSGRPWEHQLLFSPRRIQRRDIPKFVNTYIPPDVIRREEATELVAVVLERIKPLIERDPLPSPLFLRFAIEEALTGPLDSTNSMDLVLSYLDKLRIGADLSAADMERTASVAAIEAIRANGVPRELNRVQLRDALQFEADRSGFLDMNSCVVSPEAVIERLVTSGLLNRSSNNARLQFAYDPVAEYLAVRRLQLAHGMAGLRESILGSDNPVARIYYETTATEAC